MKTFLSILKVAVACILIAALLQTPYTWMIAAILFTGSIILSIAMPRYGLSYLICGQIAADIGPNCADPLIGSLEVNLYLANKQDIDSYTFNVGNNTIIEAITMLGGNTFFTYTGVKLSNEAKTTGAKLKYSFRYDHELNLVIFKVDGATKQQMELLAQGLVVAIVEWKYKGTGGNAAFEVYGREQGLEVSKLDRDSANNDTQGAYQLSLKTPDGVHEGHLPASLFITDYATTLALVQGLL